MLIEIIYANHSFIFVGKGKRKEEKPTQMASSINLVIFILLYVTIRTKFILSLEIMMAWTIFTFYIIVVGFFTLRKIFFLN